MPIHDWTRLEAGDFHHFHQAWITYIANNLNGGLLPPEFMALSEQVTGRPIPDVDEFGDMPFEFLPERPLTVASYIGGDLPTAYVETVGIGDPLPAIPLFLTEYDYVPCPLEASYMQAWEVFPAMLKELIEPPAG
jgi:hypothetical protein